LQARFPQYLDAQLQSDDGNYNLMSGETSDNDQAVIAHMLPYMWLSTRNKAITTARNQMMKNS
jgi:hypothetical protein